MYLDPYERELRLISSAMSAFLWGYSKVGYERSLDWCKRLLTVSASESEHALSHEQIADIMEVPLANVDALAEGKSMEEVMATREGEEHLFSNCWTTTRRLFVRRKSTVRRNMRRSARNVERRD